ncbi:hypothetical protein SAMN03159341_13917 [Paenibacillus sp. 1_12]|uniref:hypothetical protein n=1 Tax=Paenibacillus sp. 1_12 TaxID=1566278 RepID=UPI0008F41716|nr:hypothetical protein [Paenibacillus sp. 1_12]SFM50003.1 hypothetical protein SAMN03159341_13917 [Paenibacillus sp. 1_12]
MTSREDEIDDAVMDLSKFDDDQVIQILMKVANDVSFDYMIRASAGESLAEIWLRTSSIDFIQLGSLSEVALNEALSLIKSKRISWYKTFLELFPLKVV